MSALVEELRERTGRVSLYRENTAVENRDSALNTRAADALEALEAQKEAALALHSATWRPGEPERKWCRYCEGRGDPAPYPCATVKALGGGV